MADPDIDLDQFAQEVERVDYSASARHLVVNYINTQAEFENGPDDRLVVTYGDTNMVWFTKTLQNWKAIISTVLPDKRIYEVTFDGNKNVAYLDVYKKETNVAIHTTQRG